MSVDVTGYLLSAVFSFWRFECAASNYHYKGCFWFLVARNSASVKKICRHLWSKFCFSLLTRRLQQRAGTCFFGRWSVLVTECCPSSALRPAGPACWVPESKEGDPGPALTNHPDLHCPRGRTPDSLRAKRWAEKCLLYKWINEIPAMAYFSSPSEFCII